jgi:hypothetical protein
MLCHIYFQRSFVNHHFVQSPVEEETMFRKALFLVGLIAGVMLYAITVEDQSWTGKISDSMCGAKHMAAAEHQDSKMTEADCVTGCVKKGAKYVFVADGKIYNIDNQDFAALAEHAGQNVKLTGAMSGDTIKVSKIEMPAGENQK